MSNEEVGVQDVDCYKRKGIAKQRKYNWLSDLHINIIIF
jgi:hypothetical protein